MNIRKYIIGAMALLSLGSCDDWLGNKPKGYTIPEKYEDYVRLMNDQGLIIGYHNYPMYFTDDILLVAAGTIDNFDTFDYETLDYSYQNVYSFQHGKIFTPGSSDPIWHGCYSNIFTYNAVANNILSVPDGTEEGRRELWAEAIVARTFEYYLLVNFYGRHYVAETAETDYGVPLVLSEEMTGEKYPRASVAEVYKQMLEDLDAAIPYVSEKPSNVFKASKAGAHTLRAMIYLHMGNYEKALEDANAAMEYDKTLLDFKAYTTQTGTWGRIIKADGSGETFPERADSPENTLSRMCSYAMNLTTAVSYDLLETFEKDLPEGATDMRYRLFYSKDEMDSKRNEQFPGYSSFSPYISINIGIATPESFLIAAECEAREGDVNNALRLLNELRDTRIDGNIPYTVPTTLTREEVLQLVLDERRREFAFMGFTRFFDLKRLNCEPAHEKTVVHTVGNETWTLPPNDPRYILPVPDTVLEFNDMPQYER